MSGHCFHRDLIHRKRSPFSYKEKALGRFAKGNARLRCGDTSLAGYGKCRVRPGKSRPNLGAHHVLPLEGKGDRSAVDEVHSPDIASLASIIERIKSFPLRGRGTACGG